MSPSPTLIGEWAVFVGQVGDRGRQLCMVTSPADLMGWDAQYVEATQKGDRK